MKIINCELGYAKCKLEIVDWELKIGIVNFVVILGIFIKNGSPIQDLENITTRGENGRLFATAQEAAKPFLPLVGYFHKSFKVEACLYKRAFQFAIL